MKRSELRKMIREEFINILREGQLNEAFGDPLASKLYKMRGLPGNQGRGYRKFFDALSKKHDIDWAKMPKGSIQRKTSWTDNDLKEKGKMIFYIINKEKEAEFQPQSRYSFGGATLRPGVLGVTLSGKVLYDQLISGYRGYGMGKGDALGTAQRGQTSRTKYSKMADEIYVLDFDHFRGGTAALKAARKDLKFGATAIMNPKDFKKANLARYREIQRQRASKLSKTDIDNAILKAMAVANKAVEEAMGGILKDRYGAMAGKLAGQVVAIQDIFRYQEGLFREYEEYIKAENEIAAMDPEADKYTLADDGWYMQRHKERARSLRQDLKLFGINL